VVALQLAAFALLAPWRKAELTAPGWAIALLYPVYAATASLLYSDVTSTGFDRPSMWIAVIGVVVTGAGLVLRARWAAVGAAVSTFVLTCWLSDEWEMYVEFGVGVGVVRMAGWAIVAGIAVAILASRTARSNVGDLNNVIA
jgi:hypothetical protein